MNTTPSRREFIVQAAGTIATVALANSVGGCASNTPPAVFQYGVASGDPLTDRIILWTHAKIPQSTDSVSLTWQVATDAAFSSVVSTGQVLATKDTAFTAKVDATGLSAGSTYYYRFFDSAGSISVTGTTRTLPKSDVTSVRLAVFSCSLYSEGYFNAYEAAAKSDAQYAIHLGDYIYEYASDPSRYGNKDAVALGRVTSPANEIVSLDDYRTRYATYRGDASLQALHAKMPMIAIWDDHEFANNAWVDGAENHTSSQGDWATRKNNAAKAYHEWMPIRTDSGGNLFKIYRKFDFGSLMSLYMLDTRIEGRDRQYDSYGDSDGGIGRYVTALTSGSDATHRMMSATQQSWLTEGIKSSTGTWQVLGNQDIMARMWFPASVLQAQNTAFANPTAANQQAVLKAINDYLTAKATRFAGGAAALSSAQTSLLDSKINPRIPYNLDSWDGYPIQRETILQTVKAAGKKVVTLSGDSHNAWFANVTTLAGEKVGWEFAGTSVTSPGFESVGLGGLAGALDGSSLSTQLGSAAIGAGLGLVDDLNYVDTAQRGYLQLTVSSSSIKGEYIFVSTVKSLTYNSSIGKTISVSTAGSVTYL
jgi:alkaline phosphatase D